MVEPNKKKGGCCNSEKKKNVRRPNDNLAEVIDGIPQMQTAKIILMGDKEVGKTSIINTFVTSKSSQQAKPTNTVEDHIKMVDVNENGVTTRLKLHIWDAAGDNQVHNLAHLFVKDVQVGILVYGINSLQSFKNLDTWQEHLEKEN